MAQEKTATLSREWLELSALHGERGFDHTGKEWMDEPDVVSLEEGSFHKLIHRADLGHLCGYIGVRKSHPWYGKEVSQRVHGGVTYSDKIPWSSFAKDKYWYIGFDAGHSRDLVPSMATFGLKMGASYRNIEYIKKDVDYLYESAVKAKLEAKDEKVNHFREYRKLHKKKASMKRWAKRN